MMGLEPTTFCMASRRSSQLSYIRARAASIATFSRPARGHREAVPRIEVLPRGLADERPDVPIEVEIDEPLEVLAAAIEEWAAPLERWDVQFREGFPLHKRNNVDARLAFVGPAETTTLQFRLEQVTRIDELEQDLWLVLEEKDHFAKVLHLAPNGVDVEFFHVLGKPN